MSINICDRKTKHQPICVTEFDRINKRKCLRIFRNEMPVFCGKQMFDSISVIKVFMDTERSRKSVMKVCLRI